MKFEGLFAPVTRLGGIFPLTVILTLGACSVAPPGVDVHDPYEAMNRDVHAFNRDLDTGLVRPAALFIAQAPPEMLDPIISFSDNTALPGMVLNGVLQGDVEGAVTNTFRFLINSTIGFLGFFDPASEIGLEEHSTDFGETLAVWGVAEGAYLELPVLGPSTERDAVGELVDIAFDPLDHILPNVHQLDILREHSTAAWAAEQVIERGQFADTVDSLLYESADSYAQARLLYLQNRRFELEGAGGAETGFVDPFEDLE